MSILIKGMKMPQNCLLCYCTDTEYGECVLDPEKRCPEDYRQIAEWCPLVPVPPHGRLIDADALHEELYALEYDRENEWFDGVREARGVDAARVALLDAPTIIPAEEEN